MGMRWAWLLILPLSAQGQDSKYRVRDFEADRKVDYLAVAPESLAGPLDPLLAHRESLGRKVAWVSYEDACKGAEPGADAIEAFLDRVRGKWGVTHVLLVGDARGEDGRTIPMRVTDSAYFSETYASEKELASDYGYACAGGKEPVLHVGRFPADTAGEVQALVRRTIRYEKELAPGPWQRRLAFIAGEAGFDPLIDRVIESQFTKIVKEHLPAAFDVRLAHARAASPYCPYPPKFNDAVIDLLNEGSLFYVYVGHGYRGGCDTVAWKGEKYPILDSKDAPRVAVKNGLPVMVVIACSTGFVDAKSGDCLGEELLRRDDGPVAFIGGSRITQPYGNALIGKNLVAAAFAEGISTVGEVLTEARKRTVGDDDDPLRKTADMLAATVQGKDNLAPMREDVVRHYNLLGDPALVLRRPLDGLTVETLGIEAPGQTLTVSAKVPFQEGRVSVALDCARDKFAGALPKLPWKDGDEYARKMAERYAKANDKAWVRKEADCAGGAFSVELALPADLPEGTYFLRAFAWNGTEAILGFKEVVIGER